MDSLPILGRSVRVLWVDGLKDEGGEELDGKADYDADTILIRTGLTPHNTRQAICHELIHFLLFRSGMDHMLESYHPALPESVCRALEHGLAQVLADSRELRELFEG